MTFIQSVVCLYLYESKRLARGLPILHYTLQYTIVVSQNLQVDGIQRKDIMVLISCYLMVNLFLNTVFKTLHELATSQLKDEIKISDHRKYKQMFKLVAGGHHHR